MKPMSTHLLHWRLALLSFIAPLNAAAQPTKSALSADTSAAAEVARKLRRFGDDVTGLAILTEARGARPLRTRDDVGDTLAAIAISHPGWSTLAVRARASALTTLYLAGLGRTGLSDTVRGSLYPGAADRLRRVSEQSHDAGVRSTALRFLSELDTTPDFLPYLRQMALVSDSRAATAIEILVESRGAAGLAMARDLYRGGAIRNEVARLVLGGAASVHKW